MRGHDGHYCEQWRQLLFGSADVGLREAVLWAIAELSPLHAPQLTHPLDTLRLRIAVDPKCRTLGGAVAVLLREGRCACAQLDRRIALLNQWRFCERVCLLWLVS